MKTSLNIDDYLFEAARKEAQKRGTTIGETLSWWAQVGRKALRANRGRVRTSARVKAVNLGGAARLDLNSRRDWMDVLDG